MLEIHEDFFGMFFSTIRMLIFHEGVEAFRNQGQTMVRSDGFKRYPLPPSHAPADNIF